MADGRMCLASICTQMLVSEPGDGRLIYVNQVEAFPLYPSQEMTGAVDVAVDGVPRMSPLDEVPPERLDVGRVLHVAGNTGQDFHTLRRAPGAEKTYA
jgi:hypothetical protein